MPDEVEALDLRLGTKFSLGEKISDASSSSIIHLAGIVGEASVKSRPDSFDINVSATVDLAQQSLDLGLGKFVYVSSGHVYGPHDRPIVETDSRNPISVYAKQKLEAEERIQSIFTSEPDRLVIARVFSVLDVDMPDSSLGGLARRIQQSGLKTSLVTADDVRDFLDREAIANALVTLASSLTEHQIYNISSSTGTSVGSAMRMFLEAQGVDPELLVDLPGTSQMPQLVGDNSRFTQEFPRLKLAWKWLNEK